MRINHFLGCSLLALFPAALAFAPQAANAQATGGTITGSTPVPGGGPAASITQIAPGQMEIDQNTDRVFIDWGTFDIQPGESITFLQDAPDWIALNRVLVNSDGSPGQAFINGLLESTDGAGGPGGSVWVLAPGGVFIGSQGQVSTNGFLATTSDMTPAEFTSGDTATDNFSFIAGPSNGIVDLAQGGRIESVGGVIALVAPTVTLAGDIEQNGAFSARDHVLIAGGNMTSLDTVEGETGELDLAGYFSSGATIDNGSVQQTDGSITAGTISILANASENVPVITLAGDISVTGTVEDEEISTYLGFFDLNICGGCTTPSFEFGEGGNVDLSAATIESTGYASIRGHDIVLGDITLSEVPSNNRLQIETLGNGLLTVAGTASAPAFDLTVGDINIPVGGQMISSNVIEFRHSGQEGTFYLGGNPGETLAGATPTAIHLDAEEMSRISGNRLRTGWSVQTDTDPNTGQTLYLPTALDTVMLDGDYSMFPGGVNFFNIGGSLTVAGTIENLSSLTATLGQPAAFDALIATLPEDAFGFYLDGTLGSAIDRTALSVNTSSPIEINGTAFLGNSSLRNSLGNITIGDGAVIDGAAASILFETEDDFNNDGDLDISDFDIVAANNATLGGTIQSNGLTVLANSILMDGALSIGDDTGVASFAQFRFFDTFDVSDSATYSSLGFANATLQPVFAAGTQEGTLILGNTAAGYTPPFGVADFEISEEALAIFSGNLSVIPTIEGFAGRINVPQTPIDIIVNDLSLPDLTTFSIIGLGGDIYVPGALSDMPSILFQTNYGNVLGSGSIFFSGMAGTPDDPLDYVTLVAGNDIIIGSEQYIEAYLASPEAFDPYTLVPRLGVDPYQTFLAAGGFNFGVRDGDSRILQQNTGYGLDGGGLAWIENEEFAVLNLSADAGDVAPAQVDLHGYSIGQENLRSVDFAERVYDTWTEGAFLNLSPDIRDTANIRVNGCLINDLSNCLGGNSIDVIDTITAELKYEGIEETAAAAEAASSETAANGILPIVPSDQSEEEDETDTDEISTTFSSERRWGTRRDTEE